MGGRDGGEFGRGDVWVGQVSRTGQSIDRASLHGRAG